jgi:hypothetical protein
LRVETSNLDYLARLLSLQRQTPKSSNLIYRLERSFNFKIKTPVLVPRAGLHTV